MLSRKLGDVLKSTEEDDVGGRYDEIKRKDGRGLQSFHQGSAP